MVRAKLEQKGIGPFFGAVGKRQNYTVTILYVTLISKKLYKPYSEIIRVMIEVKKFVAKCSKGLFIQFLLI